MKAHKIFLIIISLLILSCNSIKKLQIESANKFTSIEREVFTFNDTLYLENNGKSYKIHPDGLVEINSKTAFQLETKNYIDRAFLYSDNTNLYFFYIDTDNESAGSRIQKIRLDNFNTEYVNYIYAFNLGAPIISNGKAYLTTLGFVGQMDLLTGEFDWSFKELYDRSKSSFNSFDTVIITKKTVEFISQNYKSNHIDKVVVNKINGELIEIIK